MSMFDSQTDFWAAISPAYWLYRRGSDLYNAGSTRPDGRSIPQLKTPAAPRSQAEMSSGLWTPDDVARFTEGDIRKGVQAIQANPNIVQVRTIEDSATYPKNPHIWENDWFWIGVGGFILIRMLKD